MKKIIYLLISLMLLLVGAGPVRAEKKAAADTMMRPYTNADMEHVVVRKAPKGRYCMYAGLTKLPDGEIFCAYKVGSLDPNTGSPWTIRDEEIVWTKSRNQGRTWDGPENLIYKNPYTSQYSCCGTGYLSKNGTLTLAFYVIDPINNPDEKAITLKEFWGHVYLVSTRDMGKTWILRKPDLPLPDVHAFGGIVKLRDGTLLLSLYGRRRYKPPAVRWQPATLRSVDDGRTWSDYTVIGVYGDSDTARACETDIVQTISGRLLSMSRTTMQKGVSLDNGRTWKVGPSTLTRKGVSGLCPSMEYTTAVGPPEGIVVLVYHDRWGEHANKPGMYVAFSCDEGATWGEPMWFARYAYPCVIETEPGQMFCTYYRSPAMLKGTFFGVPFPTGLLTQPAGNNSLKLKWDLYKGKKAKDYSYHIYRATGSDVKLTEENRIGIVKQTNSFNDKPLKQDKVYYYRVVARDGKNQVGVSWLAAGRTSTGSQ